MCISLGSCLAFQKSIHSLFFQYWNLQPRRKTPNSSCVRESKRVFGSRSQMVALKHLFWFCVKPWRHFLNSLSVLSDDDIKRHSYLLIPHTLPPPPPPYIPSPLTHRLRRCILYYYFNISCIILLFNIYYIIYNIYETLYILYVVNTTWLYTTLRCWT